MLQPIKLENRQDLIALLQKIVQTTEMKALANNDLPSLPQNYFVINKNGDTFIRDELTAEEVALQGNLYNNLPLRNALSSKLLRKALITGEIEEQRKREVQEIFNCPIAYELAVLPAITTAGQHYDFASIQESLARVGPRDPMTQQELHADGVVFNRVFSQLLFLYAETDPAVGDIINERLDAMRADISRSELQLREVKKQLRKCKISLAITILGACLMEVCIAFCAPLLVTPILAIIGLVCYFTPIVLAMHFGSKFFKLKEQLQQEERQQQNNLTTKNLVAEQEHTALVRFLLTQLQVCADKMFL
jgi:hypothetical protein